MRCIFFIACLLWTIKTCSQDLPLSMQQQIESLGDIIVAGEQEPEQFRKEPVNLNTATSQELQLLNLGEDQIRNFIQYRQALGPLISIYEIQAVPGWDIQTIRSIIPYIYVAEASSLKADLVSRLKGGESTLQVGSSIAFGKKTDFAASGYNLFFRYRYKFKNLLQYGLLGEKDPGEHFLVGRQQLGFDFYSAHLFIRNTGIFKSIALGDYTVNLGQGLIHWQSLALKKSGDPMMIKRGSDVLKPYSSAGEFNFLRGAAATLNWRKWESTIFISLRKLDATTNTDSLGEYFTTIRQSGYHRSNAELKYRNNLLQLSAGFNLVYRNKNWNIGTSLVYHRFNMVRKKGEQPYQFYSMTGNYWSNLSADYSYRLKNILFFGELAIDANRRYALVNGMLMPLDKKLDISFLHRAIHPGYRSLYGNAFTENSDPVNEKGVYLGVRFNPVSRLRLDLYTDVFNFPWLKFGVDKPSWGNEQLVQINWAPKKKLEIISRYRRSYHDIRLNQNLFAMNIVGAGLRRDWRMTIRYEMTDNFIWQGRMDLSWYKQTNLIEQKGFQAYMEWYWKEIIPRLSMRIRMQAFDTDSYEVRIYTYENDLSSFSAPQFSGRGQQYYTIFQYKMGQSMRLGFRWVWLIKNNSNENFNDEKMKQSHEIKCLLQYVF